MPSEARSAIINRAREKRQFPYDAWPYVLGIVTQMEAGLTLYEIISKADKSHASKPETLLQIDAASAWVRANSMTLRLELG